MPSPPEKRARRSRTEKAAVDAALEKLPEAHVTSQRKKRVTEAHKRNMARKGREVGRRCGGTNLMGEPCGSSPLLPGTVVDGVAASGDYCLFHDPVLPEGSWKRFVRIGNEALQAKPKKQRPFEVLAQAIQEAPGLLMQPYLEALGLEWNPDTGEFRRAEGAAGKGARIVGFSREGVARVSKHKDLEAQQRAAERMFDRVFGKPRQSMELAGGSAGMAIVQIPQTEERARSVAKVLIESGAVKAEAFVESPLDDDAE